VSALSFISQKTWFRIFIFIGSLFLAIQGAHPIDIYSWLGVIGGVILASLNRSIVGREEWTPRQRQEYLKQIEDEKNSNTLRIAGKR
jgi:hypothetical protein